MHYLGTHCTGTHWILIALLLSFGAAAADSATLEKMDQLAEKFNEPYAGIIISFSAEFGDAHYLKLYEKVGFLDRLRGKEEREYWYLAAIDADGRVKISEAGAAAEYYSASLDDFNEVYAAVMEKGALAKSDAIKLALIKYARWLSHLQSEEPNFSANAVAPGILKISLLSSHSFFFL